MTVEEFQELNGSLEATPDALRRLVAEVDEAALARKPSADEFSMLEHVCHLRDIEREAYAVRIEKLLGEPQPFLPDIDGSALAAVRRYNTQRLVDALDDFAAARSANLRILKTLAVEQLSRAGTQEKVGRITLEDLILKMREHDREHLETLDELRRRLSPSSGYKETS